MSRALIVIDYVNDFVAEEGALSCGKPAQLLEKKIAALIGEFDAAGAFVVVASDNHEQNDDFNPETKMFPPHCLKGSWGRELYGQTKAAAAQVAPARLILVDKQRYSAFAATALEQKLRERGLTELYLCGVCSDICVLHTAADAYNRGFGLHIYKDAVASFNGAGHEFALAHFQNCLGAEIL